MATGEQILEDVTGEQFLASGGEVDICEECCGEPGLPCINCSGTPPLDYQVSFSGISLLAGCCDYSGGSARFAQSTNPNLVYTLRQNYDGLWGTCVWGFQNNLSAFDWRIYNVASCEEPFFTRSRIVRVLLKLLPGNQVQLEYFAGGAVFFAQVSRSAPCSQVFNFTNSQQGQACFPSGVFAGVNGTAIVTPI